MQAVFPTQVHYEVQLPVTIEVTRPWNVEVWFIDEPLGRIEHLRFATMGEDDRRVGEIRTRTMKGQLVSLLPDCHAHLRVAVNACPARACKGGGRSDLAQVEYRMTFRADRPEISYRINSLRPLARRGGAACSGRASETLRREAGHDEAVVTLHAV